MNVKAALMFSGGMDSTVVLARLLGDGYDVVPMIFDDDSLTYKTKKSIAVEKILQHYQIYDNLVVIRAPKVEHMRANDTFGYIPGWKMMFQTLMMSECAYRGINSIYMGYNRGNLDGAYKDELESSILKVSDTFNSIYDTTIVVKNPYWEWTKSEMVRLGMNISVPFQHTLSCRDIAYPGLTHCGLCECCRRRKESFKRATHKDPTLYANACFSMK